jgi:hypothetical protein
VQNSKNKNFMTTEQVSIIKYGDSQISLFSDTRHDYISLTDMARAFKGSKSIESWMRNKQTLKFLDAWERLNNKDFRPHDSEKLMDAAGKQHFNLSIKQWVERTGAIGVFAKSGTMGAGTYAHKDIAFKFASWLSAAFELYIVQEFQKLKELERQKHANELLNHDQILALIRLKEVFKFVAHQEMVEDAHRDVFAAQSDSKTPFADFHRWRNEMLGISAKVIDERIKEYCVKNNIAITKTLLKKSKREKIIILDSYEAVRNAVWDFLNIKGEVNALNLANLVGDMIRTEKGEVFRKNEDTLFQTKQNLGEYDEFEKAIAELPIVTTAREVLTLREAHKKPAGLLGPQSKTGNK